MVIFFLCVLIFGQSKFLPLYRTTPKGSSVQNVESSLHCPHVRGQRDFVMSELQAPSSILILAQLVSTPSILKVPDMSPQQERHAAGHAVLTTDRLQIESFSSLRYMC